MSIELNYHRVRSDIDVDSASSEEHPFNRLTEATSEKIVGFLPVKDRYTFKEIDRYSLNLSASFEISNLKRAFTNDQGRLEQIFCGFPQLRDSDKSLREAKRKAKNYTRIQDFVAREIDPSIANLGRQKTFQLFDVAIQVIKIQEENIWRFEKHYDVEDEKEVEQKVQPRAKYELTERNVDYLRYPTHEIIAACPMSSEVFLTALDYLREGNNNNFLSRLLEENHLRRFVERDPNFTHKHFGRLRTTLIKAVEADLVKAVRNVLEVMGKKIGAIRGFYIELEHEGEFLGRLEYIAKKANSKEVLKYIRAYAKTTRLGCEGRFCYWFRAIGCKLRWRDFSPF